MKCDILSSTTNGKRNIESGTIPSHTLFYLNVRFASLAEFQILFGTPNAAPSMG